MSTPDFTFPQFLKKFPSDDVCLDYIFNMRFGHLGFCPDCAAKTKFHRIKTRKVYSCQECGFQISPCANTIFHKTKTPLTSQLFIVFLFATSRNGVSAKEIQRHLGCTYKCAFRLGHKIRSSMDEGKDIFMRGTVEIDEALFRGRKEWAKPNTHPPKRNRHEKKKRGWGADMQCVFGMVQRKEGDTPGKVRTTPVPNRKASTLLPIIVEHVAEEATVYSDEFSGYNQLGREVAEHQTVNHSNYEWSRGDVHTQGIEGHWSYRKRCILGTHTSISRKYMQNYLSEFDFRHNNRNQLLFDAILEKAIQPVS